MNWDRLQAEQEAFQSLSTLYDLARKCQEAHVRANLPLPERVRLFWE